MAVRAAARHWYLRGSEMQTAVAHRRHRQPQAMGRTATALHQVMAPRLLPRRTGRPYRQWLILSAFPVLATASPDLLALGVLTGPASAVLYRGMSQHPQAVRVRRPNAWGPHAARVRDCSDS